MTEDEFVDYVKTLHQQNLNGRENFIQAFEKGIRAAYEEREQVKSVDLADVVCSDDELDFTCEDDECKYCDADLESTEGAELVCGCGEDLEVGDTICLDCFNEMTYPD